MTRGRVAVLVLFLGAAAVLALRDAARWANSDARFQGAASQRVFDPSRNAVADLHTAEMQAGAQGKRILMDVGGNWCPWCLLLDGTIRRDAHLSALEERSFVILHVNWSSDNRNEAALSQYPRAHGYPAWYVLAPDGHLLEAKSPTDFQNNQDTSGGYNREALAKFFVNNAAPGQR